MRILTLALVLTACTDESTTDDTGTSPDTFDPYAGLAAQPGCEEVSGTATPGATGYFVGDFSIDDGVVEGVEEWVLFANQAWKDSNDEGADCSLKWDVFGTISEADSCVGCTHEIAIDASFDGEGSDCVQGLEDAEGSDLNVIYYVQASSDGTATWEFQSGTTLGEGIVNDTRAAYVSESACKWF
ncbi:MAG: hypothetical protein KC912_12465 [Proteobacteria bacterium]|nr:hypothetical protein [Pseudomonadota bacterium]